MARWVSEEAVKRLINFKGSCCTSCHDDQDEYGYELPEIDFNKDRYSTVCCAVLIAWEKWDDGEGKKEKT